MNMQVESISSTSPVNNKGTGSLPTTTHNIAAASDNTISSVSSSSNYISFKSCIQECSSPYYGNSRNRFFANTLRNGGDCVAFNSGHSLEDTKFNSLNVLLDKRLNVLLILFASTIILYKMVIVSMPLADTESVLSFKSLVESNYRNAVHWANQHQVYDILQPLLCGLAVAILGYALVYLDSNVPGVNPPSPFSPRKRMQYYQQRSSLHLGYLAAMAAGVVIAALKYFDV